MLVRKRTQKFCDEELDVLVKEILNPKNKLGRRFPRIERQRAWWDMLRRVNSVARSNRTLMQLKKRWYDVKRQRGSNIRRLYTQAVARVSGESGSEAGGDLSSLVKEEPLESDMEEIDLQLDCKLNGKMMPYVPMLKLEDIVQHISTGPLYSLDLGDPAESDPSHSNYQTSQPAIAQISASNAQVSSSNAQVSTSNAQFSTSNAQVSTSNAQVSIYDTQHYASDTQDSACHSETSDSPSSNPDQPSLSAVVDEISAEIKQMNAACSAMLINAAQIANTIKELATVLGTLTHQRRDFSERMLESMENIAVIMKKRQKYK